MNRVLSSNEVDETVGLIEKVVAGFYEIKVCDLKTFYMDSEAKFMTCFLCHHLLEMSFGKLGKTYGVFHLFLRSKINEYYRLCLTDEAFFAKVNHLKNSIQKDSCKSRVVLND